MPRSIYVVGPSSEKVRLSEFGLFPVSLLYVSYVRAAHSGVLCGRTLCHDDYCHSHMLAPAWRTSYLLATWFTIELFAEALNPAEIEDKRLIRV